MINWLDPERRRAHGEPSIPSLEPLVDALEDGFLPWEDSETEMITLWSSLNLERLPPCSAAAQRSCCGHSAMPPVARCRSSLLAR
jgi:hypothetical protein